MKTAIIARSCALAVLGTLVLHGGGCSGDETAQQSSAGGGSTSGPSAGSGTTGSAVGGQGGGTGGAGASSSAAGGASGQTGTGGDCSGGSCAPGTCLVNPNGACELPTGPQGNACCECCNSVCTAYCLCTSPDTPVATPDGDRAIASLRVGDLVYSVEHGAIVVVPIRSIHRSAVENHRVVRAELATGAALEISPGHPTADGRTFADLRRGGRLDGVDLVDVRTIPYAHAFTYDILPESETGSYFAGGVLIGSTLMPTMAAIAARH